MLKRAFGDIKDKNSYWYRSAIRAERERQKRNKQLKKDKLERRKKFKWLGLVTLVVISLYFYNQWYHQNQLSKYGINTIAIIESVKHQRYMADESGGGAIVDHYYVSFKFKVNSKWIHSFKEVKSNNYQDYIGHSPKAGDSISIRFLFESPTSNELLKLN